MLFRSTKRETPNNENDIVNQIKRLAQLKEEGILTEEEFSDKKKTLLEKIG